ncbi:G:T/U-mismatch repair DNA glycosylase [Mucilaginibacter rubeus]|uniref:hypothetical protein n=1 Tax=Mucilaginibacter rubeus TaxID=2027860 RepID=UPI00339304AD
MAEHPIKWQEELFEIEPHPYDTHIPQDARTLVIGTFPSHQKNADFKFFYGGNGNQFWPLLSVIYDRTLKKTKDDAAKRERMKLLDDFGIGITDMLTDVYRYQERSGDEYIFPIKFNNILAILDRYPDIDRLVFTSRQYIISALGLFRTFLLTEGIALTELQRHRLNYLYGTWIFKDRTIKIRVPISPSKRVIKEKKIDFDELVVMYKLCFKD